MSAAIVLPENLEDGRRYPTCYVIPGFSGTHKMAPWLLSRWKGLPGDDAMVRVLLDPSCYGGHHAFEAMFNWAQITKGPGYPEDVANLALFLSNDEYRFISGEMINVDGGVAAKT